MAAVIEWLIIAALAAAAVFVLRYERPDPATGDRPGGGEAGFVRFARIARDRAKVLVGRRVGEPGRASRAPERVDIHIDIDTDRRATEPAANLGSGIGIT